MALVRGSPAGAALVAVPAFAAKSLGPVAWPAHLTLAAVALLVKSLVARLRETAGTALATVLLAPAEVLVAVAARESAGLIAVLILTTKAAPLHAALAPVPPMRRPVLALAVPAARWLIESLLTAEVLATEAVWLGLTLIAPAHLIASELIVVAVCHFSRLPGPWFSRLAGHSPVRGRSFHSSLLNVMCGSHI